MAGALLTQQMRTQVSSVIQSQFPQMGDGVRRALAEKQVQSLLAKDSEGFEKKVEAAAEQIRARQTRKPSKIYLLGADSYYFFGLVQSIIDKGTIGVMKKGMYFNPLATAPFGRWAAIFLHPYLGYYWFQTFRFFDGEIEIMEALSYWPLILVILSAFSFFFLCAQLRIGLFATFLGSVAMMTAPVFMQRSGFGWFDTDPYVYLFVFLNLALFFRGVNEEKRAHWYGIGAGFGRGTGSTVVPASILHTYENSTAVGATAGLTIEQDGTGDAKGPGADLAVKSVIENALICVSWLIRNVSTS